MNFGLKFQYLKLNIQVEFDWLVKHQLGRVKLEQRSSYGNQEIESRNVYTRN